MWQCPLKNPVSRCRWLIMRSKYHLDFEENFWSGSFLGNSAKVFPFQVSFSREISFYRCSNKIFERWISCIFFSSWLAYWFPLIPLMIRNPDWRDDSWLLHWVYYGAKKLISGQWHSSSVVLQKLYYQSEKLYHNYDHCFSG